MVQVEYKVRGQTREIRRGKRQGLTIDWVAYEIGEMVMVKIDRGGDGGACH